MRPIATKVARELKRHSRAKVVDLDVVREAKAYVDSMSAPLPDLDDLDVTAGHRLWMNVTRDLVAFAWPLLGLNRLRKLADRIELSEEQYMPGGPPMSPIWTRSTPTGRWPTRAWACGARPWPRSPSMWRATMVSMRSC